LEGVEEPHFLTSDCKQSPWFSECKKLSADADDLSRLNRVWRNEVTSLNQAGIMTVGQLAQSHPDLLGGRVTGIPPERLRLLVEQAKALMENRAIIMGRVDLPDTDDALVVDIESDPLRDLHYLFGVLDVHKGQKEFHAFLAKHENEEKSAWESFVNFMQNNPGTPIYHYGWYEQEVFKVMTERYGAPEGFLDDMAERSIDLLIRLREAIIFPLSFYSLKDIAQYLGFRWRHDDASGLNSVLWYEEFLRTGDNDVLQDIVFYNEDDVRATWYLREWAKKNAV